MDVQIDWNPVKGSMEHPWCHASYKYLSRKTKLRDSILPQRLFGMAFLERQFRSSLRKLRSMDYAKSTTLIWLVPYFSQVGISPKVIVSFRDFESFALSRYSKFAWDFDKLVDSYVNVYMTAWLQLHLYGGIIVDYADMCNTGENEWIFGVSTLTGLSTEDLTNNRDRIVKPLSRKSMPLPQQMCSRIYEVAELFSQHKNRVFVGEHG